MLPDVWENFGRYAGVCRKSPAGARIREYRKKKLLVKG
jgi:hypothetical protein